ncbi:hypothetical protein CYLTODRAFT_458376 [Cylindrobasidium torrendii FP15055 ss-10]|uniref:Uncharacterized protein n=1 Tax=Cylindrobasidium torrendii FP15055 ss-10 TaxID=1314674 RepID=A0A0D7AZ23_9AGAR|nr:hypothetical protein CYLTODRAFT_458376 [Cylindrobasidium torrendii FP15055 ss-10]
MTNSVQYTTCRAGEHKWNLYFGQGSPIPGLGSSADVWADETGSGAVWANIKGEWKEWKARSGEDDIRHPAATQLVLMPSRASLGWVVKGNDRKVNLSNLKGAIQQHRKALSKKLQEATIPVSFPRSPSSYTLPPTFETSPPSHQPMLPATTMLTEVTSSPLSSVVQTPKAVNAKVAKAPSSPIPTTPKGRQAGPKSTPTSESKLPKSDLKHITTTPQLVDLRTLKASPQLSATKKKLSALKVVPSPYKAAIAKQKPNTSKPALRPSASQDHLPKTKDVENPSSPHQTLAPSRAQTSSAKAVVRKNLQSPLLPPTSTGKPPKPKPKSKAAEPSGTSQSHGASPSKSLDAQQDNDASLQEDEVPLPAPPTKKRKRLDSSTTDGIGKPSIPSSSTAPPRPAVARLRLPSSQVGSIIKGASEKSASTNSVSARPTRGLPAHAPRPASVPSLPRQPTKKPSATSPSSSRAQPSAVKPASTLQRSFARAASPRPSPAVAPTLPAASSSILTKAVYSGASASSSSHDAGGQSRKRTLQDISQEIVEDSEEERPRKRKKTKRVSFVDSRSDGLGPHKDKHSLSDDLDDEGSPRKRPPRTKRNTIMSDDEENAVPSPDVWPTEAPVEASVISDGGPGSQGLVHGAFDQDHDANDNAILAHPPSVQSPLTSVESPTSTTNSTLSYGSKSKGKHIVDKDHPMDAPSPPENSWQENKLRGELLDEWIKRRPDYYQTLRAHLIGHVRVHEPNGAFLSESDLAKTAAYHEEDQRIADPQNGVRVYWEKCQRFGTPPPIPDIPPSQGWSDIPELEYPAESDAEQSPVTQSSPEDTQRVRDLCASLPPNASDVLLVPERQDLYAMLTLSRSDLPGDQRLKPCHKVAGSGALLRESMVKHYLVNHCYDPAFSSDDFAELCWKLAG